MKNLFKTGWIILTAVLMILGVGPVEAQTELSAEALARKSGCFECHAVDRKKNIKGPAFSQVAARYRDNVENYELSFVFAEATHELPRRPKKIGPHEKKKSRIILAMTRGGIHLRIFDQNNKLVVDKAEYALKDRALMNLRARLMEGEAVDGSVMSPEARLQIVEHALSAAGYTHREVLIQKITRGGKGNWTDITHGAPMPPYSRRLSTEEIEHLVDWILGL